jgi:putative iron-dependent peroxidase
VSTQAVLAPVTRSAIFLVVTINDGDDNCKIVRDLCGDFAALVRAIGHRDESAALSCVVAFGSEAWNRLFTSPRPKELHVLPEYGPPERRAISTPGDMLFHVRADRMDMCFELVAQIMDRIGHAVTIVDETHGFRYFDNRAIVGFVDGTENPTGDLAHDSVVVGEEDAAFAGGSYVIVQKYFHRMDKWNALTVEAQERVIGRTKLEDIELEEKPVDAHNALTIIEEGGKEIKILRDNMPFGRPGHGEFGTYFIGYSRSPRSTELMLENMFVGRPPGTYDRLLDFSYAVTGTLFFAPPASFLESCA